MSLKIRLAIAAFVFLTGLVSAQKVIKGVVQDKNGQALTGANIAVEGQKGTITDERGHFSLVIEGLKEGLALNFSFMGYQPQKVPLEAGKKFYQVTLEESRLDLHEIVVSAERSAQTGREAPITVDRLGSKQLKQVQALSLAEGLAFSPGLRTENNCQNCGFTQVRINGLDGAYSQILIDSRPVFSSLMGVYGLEMIPPNMIERVEVVKGGGSALYGGNAIGGTINIITAEPNTNSFQIGSDLLWLENGFNQQAYDFSGSLITDDGQAGLQIFAFNRERRPWDANNDGFTEIAQLNNLTFGLKGFYKPAARSKLGWHFFQVDEYRRGGNDLELEPHQADIAEELDHRIYTGGLDYEWLSRDGKHRLAAYLSFQSVGRESYYGGGGRVLGPGDSLTAEDLLALNAYGESENTTVVSGLQYHYRFNQQWSGTLGTELRRSTTDDEMPGYGRSIYQQVQNLGLYAQLAWRPWPALELNSGLRSEIIRLRGQYDLGQTEQNNQRRFETFAPRLAARYFLNDHWTLRSSCARGFRAPQAFDEDLHIETVGGAALFTQLAPDLKMEFSNAWLLSARYQKTGLGYENDLLLEFFRTDLLNPFILSDQRELDNGTAVITKRNGDGAWVMGVNLEYNLALGKKWLWQTGITWQQSRYRQAELIWENGEGDEQVSTTRLLRTPDVYGFLAANWQFSKPFSLDLSVQYTGSMFVPHVVDASSERTVLEQTPEFLDLSFKFNYELALSDELSLNCYAGLRNLLNAYQNDFDRGAERDAGYIYGPLMPRAFTFGVDLAI